MNPYILPGTIETPEQQIEKIAELYNVTVNDLKSGKRQRMIVEARHMAFYQIRKEFSFTVMKIGEMFNCNHSTVTYGVRHYEILKETNQLLV